MAKRRFGIIVLLLCFCLCAQPCQVLAVSTTDAKEPISISKECRLTISYGYKDIAFSNQSVKLYKIADVSANFQYTLTAPFTTSGLILNGIQTNGEWNVIRSTLETQILADKIAPIKEAETNASGQALFTGLAPGLYLASAVKVAQDDLACFFDAVLVALPGLETSGLWQYQVAAAAKPQVLPPTQPDEEIQLKILKLWRGDEGGTDRPNHIEVEIFRDGISYETIALSAENNWSYSWSAKDSGADWKVMERNVPAGYIMTVQQRDTTFVITNTRPDNPISPPPQTGDTSNILPYTVALYVSGMMLILLGIIGKRKHHEETD